MSMNVNILSHAYISVSTPPCPRVEGTHTYTCERKGELACSLAKPSSAMLHHSCGRTGPRPQRCTGRSGDGAARGVIGGASGPRRLAGPPEPQARTRARRGRGALESSSNLTLGYVSIDLRTVRQTKTIPKLPQLDPNKTRESTTRGHENDTPARPPTPTKSATNRPPIRSRIGPESNPIRPRVGPESIPDRPQIEPDRYNIEPKPTTRSPPSDPESTSKRPLRPRRMRGAKDRFSAMTSQVVSSVAPSMLASRGPTV